MRVFLFLLTIIVTANFLSAQKIVKKSFANNRIDLININSENCFEVTLETSTVNEISVLATINGEYQRDLSVQINEEESTLSVSAGFTPNFTNPNDKLSAHKVISISLHIIIPNNKNVKLYGKSSNVNASGNFNDLDISLSDGYCKLTNIGNHVSTTTQSGDIFLENNTATITATTKYGKIYDSNIPKGNGVFLLSSITGNIHISKTK
ncbi:DUF4097 family beta strand repeat-containing protein [Cellulophaga sp. F20128]|uniref:DUF4097 family beta strand repeat-containing protein n=1 Tax=Cellulophaga sp. F20128 TaxID=2926413 RepID=UPI001FF64ACC|nr:DUF4097 family beta strand repeat-containing protein [Cellulophaga sp. F20128]MCK0157424.1 DUF4097 family beta strand repeat-containing protein [Cellulophaga sp. F20128]